MYPPRSPAPGRIPPSKVAPLAELASPPRQHPATVLIAEDDEPLRGLLARTLQEAGYRTLNAADGRAALQLAHLSHPDLHLVVTDVMLPKLNGHELGRHLGVMSPDIPVIYMSAYRPGDIFRRDAPSGTMFLQKPFALDALVAAVRSVLGAKQVGSRQEQGAGETPAPS